MRSRPTAESPATFTTSRESSGRLTTPVPGRRSERRARRRSAPAACVGRRLDPGTGEFLPSWDEALDAIGPDDEPRHVARFGAKLDAQGVLAASKSASRCIGYLTKYLTKQLGDCHQPDNDAQRDHVERLADALRYERARRCARTGCATESSQRTPARAWCLADAVGTMTRAALREIDEHSPTPHLAQIWHAAMSPARSYPEPALRISSLTSGLVAEREVPEFRT
ncbi:MAG: replication initiator [Streptosporangiaceae bacterium]